MYAYFFFIKPSVSEIGVLYWDFDSQVMSPWSPITFITLRASSCCLVLLEVIVYKVSSLWNRIW